MIDKVYKSEVRDILTGNNVRIVEPCNLYECSLGDNVFIGPFVEVQSDVVVGSDTKIQSHSFICSKVSIGSNCFIGHGVMFINDTFSSGKPAQGNESLWKETVISDQVYIGSNSTILPVEICPNVVIGAGSVVTKSILEPGTYAGNPARKIEKVR